MSSLLAIQLSRHPSLRVVDRETVWTKHPGVYDGVKGRKVVPAAHDNPPSVYMNPVKNVYGDRLLPDGRTIEFHPSSSDVVNGKLHRLLGREAAFYAYVGNDGYRAGKVVVERRPMSDGVFHLRLITPPLPAAAGPAPAPAPDTAPEKKAWADMTDSD